MANPAKTARARGAKPGKGFGQVVSSIAKAKRGAKSGSGAKGTQKFSSQMSTAVRVGRDRNSRRISSTQSPGTYAK